jgi:hypothetical protein
MLLVLGFALVIFWDEIGFFLFLLLLGGGLSYLGDQLGSYCGKQRLSLFGLRPKYTAGLINLGTGVLITVLTFGGAAWMSDDVRVALFRVSDLRQRAEQLRLQELVLKEDVVKAREEVKGARKRYLDAVAQSRAVETEKRKLMQENHSLSQRNSGLTTQNFELVSSNKELASRRVVLSRTIQEKLVEIERLNLALEKKETAPVVISRYQILLDESAAVPLDVTTSALQGVLRNLTQRISTRVQLLDVQFDTRSEEYLVRYGSQKVLSRLREIEAFYRSGVQRGKLTEGEIPRECHIVPISTRNVSVRERLARIAFDVRPNLLILKQGEEVARTVVDASLAPEKILDQLLYFDQQVQTVLREQGVSSGSLPRQGLGSDPSRLLELVRIADAVSGSGKDRVILCQAAGDLYAFGKISLVYLVEAKTPFQESQAATLEATGSLSPVPELKGFKIPAFASLSHYAPAPRDPSTKGSELILPESTMLSESLPSNPLGLGVVPASSPPLGSGGAP